MDWLQKYNFNLEKLWAEKQFTFIKTMSIFIEFPSSRMLLSNWWLAAANFILLHKNSTANTPKWPCNTLTSSYKRCLVNVLPTYVGHIEATLLNSDCFITSYKFLREHLSPSTSKSYLSVCSIQFLVSATNNTTFTITIFTTSYSLNANITCCSHISQLWTQRILQNLLWGTWASLTGHSTHNLKSNFNFTVSWRWSLSRAVLCLFQEKII